MNERQIEELAARLGVKAAGQVDPERTAQRVLARLRTERPARRPWWGAPMLRAAAAVALLAASVLGVRALVDREAPGSLNGSLGVVPWGIEALEVVDLAEVLDSLTVEAPVSQLATRGLDDLTEPQLQELLQRMEG